MKFNCFPIVMLAVDNASEEYAETHRIVPERVEILKQYCDAVDLLISQRDGNGFSFDVDPQDMTLHMEFALSDIEVFHKNKDLFPQLASRSLRFSVEHCDSTHIRVELVYPSLWEETE